MSSRVKVRLHAFACKCKIRVSFCEGVFLKKHHPRPESVLFASAASAFDDRFVKL